MGLANDIKLLIQHPTIVTATRTANWNSGVATSGQPGADLFTYGIAGQWWRASQSYFQLAAFNAAATVTVRFYQIMFGALQYTGGDDYIVAVDGPVVYLLWWLEIEMFGPMRIELFSDQAADDGAVIPYEYWVKEW